MTSAASSRTRSLTSCWQGARTEEEIVGPGGFLAQLTKRLVERAMEVELTDHLGYEPHREPPGATGNTRNGSTPKTLATEHGPAGINTPRDRDGSFEPKIVRKRQRRWSRRLPRCPREATSAMCEKQVSDRPGGNFSCQEDPALSPSPKRADQASPPGRIQRQSADLLSLLDEHLQVDSNRLPLRGRHHSPPLVVNPSTRPLRVLGQRCPRTLARSRLSRPPICKRSSDCARTTTSTLWLAAKVDCSFAIGSECAGDHRRRLCSGRDAGATRRPADATGCIDHMDCRSVRSKR